MPRSQWPSLLRDLRSLCATFDPRALRSHLADAASEIHTAAARLEEAVYENASSAAADLQRASVFDGLAGLLLDVLHLLHQLLLCDGGENAPALSEWSSAELAGVHGLIKMASGLLMASVMIMEGGVGHSSHHHLRPTTQRARVAAAERFISIATARPCAILAASLQWSETVGVTLSATGYLLFVASLSEGLAAAIADDLIASGLNIQACAKIANN